MSLISTGRKKGLSILVRKPYYYETESNIDDKSLNTYGVEISAALMWSLQGRLFGVVFMPDCARFDSRPLREVSRP
jgi:beta-glucanase (GH16 family)